MTDTRRESAFFDGVTHEAVLVEGKALAAAFFYRVGSFDVVFPVARRWAEQVLHATPLRPIGLLPGKALATITAASYEDSDVGPYNEVVVGIPVVLGHPGGPVSLLRWMRRGGGMFVWRVAVTTELAQALGVSVLGWPKFLADIRIDYASERLSCSVERDGRPMLELSAPRPRCRPKNDRLRFDIYALRGDRLMRGEAIDHVLETGTSLRGDVQLTIQDHPLLREMRDAGFGSALGVSASPRHEMVLSAALEAWPGPPPP